jgi:hypothetical protein
MGVHLQVSGVNTADVVHNTSGMSSRWVIHEALTTPDTCHHAAVQLADMHLSLASSLSSLCVCFRSGD